MHIWEISAFYLFHLFIYVGINFMPNYLCIDYYLLWQLSLEGKTS